MVQTYTTQTGQTVTLDFVSLQQYSRDDSAINSKEESRQIKCESSPPTPRALRLERVAAALAKSPDDASRWVNLGFWTGAWPLMMAFNSF